MCSANIEGPPTTPERAIGGLQVDLRYPPTGITHSTDHVLLLLVSSRTGMERRLREAPAVFSGL